jgi:hypothetical protein
MSGNRYWGGFRQQWRSNDSRQQQSFMSERNQNDSTSNSLIDAAFSDSATSATASNSADAGGSNTSGVGLPSAQGPANESNALLPMVIVPASLVDQLLSPPSPGATDPDNGLSSVSSDTPASPLTRGGNPEPASVIVWAMLAMVASPLGSRWRHG